MNWNELTREQAVAEQEAARTRISRGIHRIHTLAARKEIKEACEEIQRELYIFGWPLPVDADTREAVARA